MKINGFLITKIVFVALVGYGLLFIIGARVSFIQKGKETFNATSVRNIEKEIQEGRQIEAKNNCIFIKEMEDQKYYIGAMTFGRKIDKIYDNYYVKTNIIDNEKLSELFSEMDEYLGNNSCNWYNNLL